MSGRPTKLRGALRDWLAWFALALFGWLVYVMVSSVAAKGGESVGADDLLFVVGFPAALTALVALAVGAVRSKLRRRRS